MSWRNLVGESSGFGANSGEEHQFDFTGAGTVLLQSSESSVADPHLLRRLEGQVEQLDVAGLGRMQSVIAEKLAAQQQQQR